MKTTSTAFTPALLIASLMAAASSLAAPSASAQADVPLSVTVRLDDLDVTTAAGAELAYTRIAKAAERVCPPLISSNIQAKARMSSCVQKALARSIAKLNQPALTALYVTRNDGRLAAKTAMSLDR